MFIVCLVLWHGRFHILTHVKQYMILILLQSVIHDNFGSMYLLHKSIAATKCYIIRSKIIVVWVGQSVGMKVGVYVCR